jgi:hypothetical protein
MQAIDQKEQEITCKALRSPGCTNPQLVWGGSSQFVGIEPSRPSLCSDEVIEGGVSNSSLVGCNAEFHFRI